MNRLLWPAEQEGLLVREQPLTKHDGLVREETNSNPKRYRNTDRKILFAGWGIEHPCTSAGHILVQTDTNSRKQEYNARLYGYNLKIRLTGLIRFYEAEYRNLYAISEYLDAAEEYLKETIDCCKSKYGSFVSVHQFTTLQMIDLLTNQLF